MKNTILIQTQYEENYGAHDWDGKGNCPQHWKMKGGRAFQIVMDADLCMYTDASTIFQVMLDNDHNDDYARYTYLDHSIQFSQPILLGTEAEYIKNDKALVS